MVLTHERIFPTKFKIFSLDENSTAIIVPFSSSYALISGIPMAIIIRTSQIQHSFTRVSLNGNLLGYLSADKTTHVLPIYQVSDSVLKRSNNGNLINNEIEIIVFDQRGNPKNFSTSSSDMLVADDFNITTMDILYDAYLSTRQKLKIKPRKLLLKPG